LSINFDVLRSMMLFVMGMLFVLHLSERGWSSFGFGLWFRDLSGSSFRCNLGLSFGNFTC
jgi:hypothetical protein